MKADIRLIYGLQGETYHGRIMVQVYPTRGFISEKEFTGFTFPRMMSHLARTIRAYEVGAVILARLELEDSAYVMDAETVELLRTDPAAAISAMTVEDRTVMVRERGAASSHPPPGLLRAGHDTIGASFGEHLYCHVQEGRFECLGCGRWSGVTPTSAPCEVKGCVTVYGRLQGSRWFTTTTAEVLKLKLDRYYLPRIWNPSRGWIKHEALNKMYESFLQEREECYQATAPRV